MILMNTYALILILNISGPPSATNYYLFNGDIVDKGQHSIEVSEPYYYLLRYVCQITNTIQGRKFWVGNFLLLTTPLNHKHHSGV